MLHPIVRPFAGATGDKFVLIHDNAPSHIAIVTMDYIARESIDVMGWVARSLDLNLIEHISAQADISAQNKPIDPTGPHTCDHH